MKLKYCTIAEVVTAILMIYEIWYIEDFGSIPMFLQILAMLLFASVFWMNRFVIQMSTELNYWLVFGVSSLCIGMFIVDDRSVLISSIITYISFILVCYLVYQICLYNCSVTWLVKIILAANCICAVSVIFWGEDYNNGIHVITMGSNNNPNYLGISMIYGVFACIMLMQADKVFRTLVYCLVIGCFGYVTILSGSRSSILGFVLFLLVTAAFSVDTKKLLSSIKIRHFVYFVLGIAAIVVVGKYVNENLMNSAAWERFMLLTEENGAHGRTDLYQMAFSLFKESPFVGVGYNNFSNASGAGYFSHSTYAETIACTGIIGMLLWFAPYLICAKKIWLLKQAGTKNISKMIGLFVVLVFMGIFGILYYTLQSMIIFTMLIAYADIELEDISYEEVGHEEEIHSIGS